MGRIQPRRGELCSAANKIALANQMKATPDWNRVSPAERDAAVKKHNPNNRSCAALGGRATAW